MIINSEITNQTLNKLIENAKVHIKIDVTNNSVNENRPAYQSTITYKIDNALSNVENLVVKVDGVNSNLEPVYNSTTNEITINNIEKITPGQIVTLEYDTTINSNIQNKGELGTNVELSIDVKVKVYSLDINTLNSTYQNKYSNAYNETKGSVKVTGVYTQQSGGVESKYITNEEIAFKEEKTGLQGEEYTT